MKYDEFLARKREKVEPCGFEVDDDDIHPALFPWQRRVVKWALKRGRAALFEDCGLGKTVQQVEWARQVLAHPLDGQDATKSVLILAPLAVSEQTIREASKILGVKVSRCNSAKDVEPAAINITNYERLDKFAPEAFSGIVLDESSILKAYDGKTRQAISAFARSIPFRLCCTATPAPNDTIELVNHAEFLDIMGGKEILALFFRQDGNTTHKWRLKGHAKAAFWRWMAEWSIAMQKPSDVGGDDTGYVLPALEMHQQMVSNQIHEGFLFAMEAKTLKERRDSRRNTIAERAGRAAALANGNREQWLVWCDLNDEGDAITDLIPDAKQVKGSDSPEYKERTLNDFATGKLRVLVSKPSIAGFGMNFQSCSHMAFVGLSDSYEMLYQAIRRCWRFGQTRPVECHIICADSDGAVIENIRRKDAQAREMFAEIIAAMAGANEIMAARRNEMKYDPLEAVEIPGWLKSVA